MRLVERIVAFSCRNALLVALVLVGAAVTLGVYTAAHFRMNTNTETLVSRNTAWRQREIAYDRLFPQENNLVLVVIDGATPERAEYAASALSAALTPHREAFLSVRRPDGGPFFAREGMLFLSTREVKETAAELIKAQPFLGALAADPSLRGVMESLSTTLLGVKTGATKLEDLARPIGALTRPLTDALHGKRTFLAWRSLVTGTAPKPVELRRFIEVQQIGRAHV